MKLSPDKAKLKAEGACFYCKEKGHRIRECPKKPARPQYPITPKTFTPPQTLKGKELHTHIRFLLMQLSEEEQNEVFAMQQEQDQKDF